MEDEQFDGDQHSLELMSSDDRKPLSDGDFRALFESGRVDGLLVLRQTMRQTRMAMSLADARADTHPLVYVNEAFSQLTGYSRQEIMNRNCRFLQGAGTDEETIKKIGTCLRNEEVGVFEIKNYRKDGSAFWNALHVGPVYDAQGKLQYYFASQWDITELYESRAAQLKADLVQRELHHRSLNMFAVISSLISLSGIGTDDVDVAMKRARDRVGALAEAHRASVKWTAQDVDVRLKPMIDTLLAPYVDHENGNIRVGGEDCDLPASALTVVGMVVHELATNSIKYGFLGGKALSADLVWTVNGDKESGRKINMSWRETFMEGALDDAVTNGSGTRIVRALLEPGGGSIDRKVADDTFAVELVIPIDVEFN